MCAKGRMAALCPITLVMQRLLLQAKNFGGPVQAPRTHSQFNRMSNMTISRECNPQLKQESGTFRQNIQVYKSKITNATEAGSNDSLRPNLKTQHSPIGEKQIQNCRSNATSRTSGKHECIARESPFAAVSRSQTRGLVYIGCYIQPINQTYKGPLSEKYVGGNGGAGCLLPLRTALSNLHISHGVPRL